MTQFVRIIIFFLIFFILSGIATSATLNEPLMNQSIPQNLSEVVEVPDVQSILNNPAQYYGKTISLKAVVSMSYPEKKQFNMADRVGCSLCTAKNAKNSVIIWYDGEIPKYLDIIQITGEVIPEKNKRYHINATTVKK
jgi:hypothetical protein